MSDDLDSKSDAEPAAEAFAEFEARDRAAHPHAWAVHDHLMSNISSRQIARSWIEGGKEFSRCGRCGKIVQLNKALFGSMHLCR